MTKIYDEEISNRQDINPIERAAIVSNSNIGKQLCRIVPMEYDDKIFDLCIDSWEKLGYCPI